LFYLLLKNVAAVKPFPVETQQKEEVYEETRKVEADMTFSKQRQAFAAADTEQGSLYSLFFDNLYSSVFKTSSKYEKRKENLTNITKEMHIKK